MEKQLIDDINRLAKKQREEGLTPEEVLLQQQLRKRYLEEFRANFKKMLDNIEITDGELQ